MRVKIVKDVTVNHGGELFNKGDKLDLTKKEYEAVKDFVIVGKAEEEAEEEVAELTYDDLKALAKEAKIEGYTKMSKDELAEALAGV